MWILSLAVAGEQFCRILEEGKACWTYDMGIERGRSSCAIGVKRLK